MSLRRWIAAGAFVALVVGAANAQSVQQVVNSIVATTCTNQFVRSIAATGSASCATVGTSDLASSLTLTTPDIGVATATTINGAAINNTAWTAYTPTVTCGQSSGSAVCTGSGRSKTIGKTTFVTVQVTVSGTFTAGTISTATLPVNSSASALTVILSGRETSATGLAWVGTIIANSSTVQINTPSNGNTIVSGYVILVSGVYENT